MASIPDKVGGGLSYVGGIVTGIVFYIVGKDSPFIKFHAIQSILLSALLIAVNIVVQVSRFIFLRLPGGGIVILILNFTLAVATVLFFILWLIAMIKAFKEDKFVIPVIGQIAEGISNS